MSMTISTSDLDGLRKRLREASKQFFSTVGESKPEDETKSSRGELTPPVSPTDPHEEGKTGAVLNAEFNSSSGSFHSDLVAFGPAMMVSSKGEIRYNGADLSQEGLFKALQFERANIGRIDLHYKQPYELSINKNHTAWRNVFHISLWLFALVISVGAATKAYVGEQGFFGEKAPADWLNFGEVGSKAAGFVAAVPSVAFYFFSNWKVLGLGFSHCKRKTSKQTFRTEHAVGPPYPVQFPNLTHAGKKRAVAAVILGIFYSASNVGMVLPHIESLEIGGSLVAAIFFLIGIGWTNLCVGIDKSSTVIDQWQDFTSSSDAKQEEQQIRLAMTHFDKMLNKVKKNVTDTNSIQANLAQQLSRAHRHNDFIDIYHRHLQFMQRLIDGRSREMLQLENARSFLFDPHFQSEQEFNHCFDGEKPLSFGDTKVDMPGKPKQASPAEPLNPWQYVSYSGATASNEISAQTKPLDIKITMESPRKWLNYSLLTASAFLSACAVISNVGGIIELLRKVIDEKLLDIFFAIAGSMAAFSLNLSHTNIFVNFPRACVKGNQLRLEINGGNASLANKKQTCMNYFFHIVGYSWALFAAINGAFYTIDALNGYSAFGKDATVPALVFKFFCALVTAFLMGTTKGEKLTGYLKKPFACCFARPVNYQVDKEIVSYQDEAIKLVLKQFGELVIKHNRLIKKFNVSSDHMIKLSKVNEQMLEKTRNVSTRAEILKHLTAEFAILKGKVRHMEAVKGLPSIYQVERQFTNPACRV